MCFEEEKGESIFRSVIIQFRLFLLLREGFGVRKREEKEKEEHEQSFNLCFNNCIPLLTQTHERGAHGGKNAWRKVWKEERECEKINKNKLNVNDDAAMHEKFDKHKIMNFLRMHYMKLIHRIFQTISRGNRDSIKLLDSSRSKYHNLHNSMIFHFPSDSRISF